MTPVLLAIALSVSGCSVFSRPTAPPPQTVAQAPTAAQTEDRAANRDSTSTQGTIATIQGRLARDGFYHGPIDGVWGPDSSAALRDYQRAHGLEDTGKLDRPTVDSFSVMTK